MVIAVVSLALSAGDELRASFGSAVAAAGARDGAARRGGVVPGARRRGGGADRRRARHRRLPAARAARADAGARSRGRWRREDRAARQRRRARGRLLGGRVAALRAAREARLPGLEERVRAGRVRLVLGAARRHARLRVPRARRAGGRARGDDGRGARRRRRLHRVQEAFVEAGAVQCGFCTPGLVVAAADLLAREPEPDATTRSARRCRATSAAAPATRRSSTRCDWPRRGRAAG